MHSHIKVVLFAVCLFHPNDYNIISQIIKYILGENTVMWIHLQGFFLLYLYHEL